MPNIILNEQAQASIQRILQSLPISELGKVQELIGILNASIETATEEPKPIGGGGTGGAPKPKE
jgi:hypothetical protein